jgi:hypothetical protein
MITFQILSLVIVILIVVTLPFLVERVLVYNIWSKIAKDFSKAYFMSQNLHLAVHAEVEVQMMIKRCHCH